MRWVSPRADRYPGPYSLSTEVKKGLRQKAIADGTVSRTPLGYFNIRQCDSEGREYRTVDVDPARAPLIAWAFEAYATGAELGIHRSTGLRGYVYQELPAKAFQPRH